MTTAARPTFDPARANDGKAPTFQYSSRDLAAHTKLKYRQTGQLTQEEIEKVDLKEELLKAEKEHFENKKHGNEDNEDNNEDQSIKRRKLLLESTAQLDADDESDDSDDSDDSEEEEEEDDTAALLAELEKIKKERAEEKERQELEKSKERQEEIMKGNPLIANANKDFNVRRRWDDDVIFKNQARGVEDKPKKRFINDTLRSDFHRKFMNKYVK